MGGGQCNADDFKIPLGSGLPVGNGFNVWFMRYGEKLAEPS